MDRIQERLDRLLAEFLRRMARQMGAAAVDRLARADLSLTQVRLLLTLASRGTAMPVGELAGQLAVPVATASRNVDQLVRLDLLERTESSDDRRVKLVSLSAAGVTLTDEYLDSQREAMRAFVETLPVETCEPLADALEAIVAGGGASRKAKGAKAHGGS